MPKEDTHKSSLPLEEVTRIAKEVILKDGYHLPTVIADGSLQNIISQIERFAPTHEERVQQLFLLGAILAERADFGVLQQVFLITEAWMSEVTPENFNGLPPSQDPKRTEVLMISRLSLHPLPPRTDVVVFEMKRDEQGTLTSLDDLGGQRAAEGMVSADSPLLEAFAIGFLGSAPKPDD